MNTLSNKIHNEIANNLENLIEEDAYETDCSACDCDVIKLRPFTEEIMEKIGDFPISNFIPCIKRVAMLGYAIKPLQSHLIARYGDSNEKANSLESNQTVGTETKSAMSQSDNILENLADTDENFNRYKKRKPNSESTSNNIQENISVEEEEDTSPLTESDKGSDLNSNIDNDILNQDMPEINNEPKISRAILLLKSGINPRLSTSIYFMRMLNEGWKLTKESLREEGYKSNSPFASFYFKVLDRDLNRCFEPFNNCTIDGNISDFIKALPDLVLTYIYGGLPYVSYAAITMLMLFKHWLSVRPDIIKELGSKIKSIEDIFIEFTNATIKNLLTQFGSPDFSKFQFCSIMVHLSRTIKKIIKSIDNPFESEFIKKKIFVYETDPDGIPREIEFDDAEDFENNDDEDEDEQEDEVDEAAIASAVEKETERLMQLSETDLRNETKYLNSLTDILNQKKNEHYRNIKKLYEDKKVLSDIKKISKFLYAIVQLQNLVEIEPNSTLYK